MAPRTPRSQQQQQQQQQHASSSSSLSLPALTAGEALHLVIESRDHHGLRLAHGGEHLQASLNSVTQYTPYAVIVDGRESTMPAELRITDQGNGLYELSCVIYAAGRYGLHVGCGARDEPIGGTPLPLLVQPGRVQSTARPTRGLLAAQRARRTACSLKGLLGLACCCYAC